MLYSLIAQIHTDCEDTGISKYGWASFVVPGGK